IQITHRNLSELHFRAWRVDLRELIDDAEDYNLLPAYREIPQIMSSRNPDASWQVKLPETVDLRDHKTFVDPPMQRAGLWVIAASVRRDFRQSTNHIQAVNLILTDLVLETASLGMKHEIIVRSGETGERLSGIPVTLYRYDWNSGHKRIKTYTSDDHGSFIIGRRVMRDRQHFLYAERDDDIALDRSYLSRLHESSED
ncbi:MAG: hypothetical protein GY906_40675, partial [bacterium]|nr:hypothetical protein [bacterium]